MSNNLPRLSNVLRSGLKLEIKRNLNNNGAEYLAYQLWKENEQTKYVHCFFCFFFFSGCDLWSSKSNRNPSTLRINLLCCFIFQFNNMENAEEFDSTAVCK